MRNSSESEVQKRIDKIERELSKPQERFGGQSLRQVFLTDQISIATPPAQKYMRLVMELDMLTGRINY